MSDSGIVHALLNIAGHEALLGHPVVGGSWEGFVSAAGAEIDLLLEMPGHGLWAIDIKRGLSALPEKAFHITCDDVKPAKRFVVNSGTERYSISKGVEAIGLAEMAATLLAT